MFRRRGQVDILGGPEGKSGLRSVVATPSLQVGSPPPPLVLLPV